MHHSPYLVSTADPVHVHEAWELDPDVDNALYDLLVQDEELEAAGQRTYDDLEHMMNRLAGLDESHPAFLPLVEIVNLHLWNASEDKPDFKDVANSAGRQYIFALEAVDRLNRHQFLPMAGWVLALAGVGVTAATVNPAGASFSGAIVGNGLGRAGGKIRDTRRSLDEYLVFADKLHAQREEFDTLYDRLVLREDSEPDDLARGEA